MLSTTPIEMTRKIFGFLPMILEISQIAVVALLALYTINTLSVS